MASNKVLSFELRKTNRSRGLWLEVVENELGKILVSDIRDGKYEILTPGMLASLADWNILNKVRFKNINPLLKFDLVEEFFNSELDFYKNQLMLLSAKNYYLEDFKKQKISVYKKFLEVERNNPWTLSNGHLAEKFVYSSLKKWFFDLNYLDNGGGELNIKNSNALEDIFEKIDFKILYNYEEKNIQYLDSNKKKSIEIKIRQIGKISKDNDKFYGIVNIFLPKLKKSLKEYYLNNDKLNRIAGPWKYQQSHILKMELLFKVSLDGLVPEYEIIKKWNLLEDFYKNENYKKYSWKNKIYCNC